MRQMYELLFIYNRFDYICSVKMYIITKIDKKNTEYEYKKRI